MSELKLQEKQKKILEQAIQKAQSNGFMPEWEFVHTTNMGWTKRMKGPPLTKPGEAYITYMLSEEQIIFDHDFAKALWGDGWANFTEGQSGDLFSLQAPNWKGHLMNMVISVNPINYLGKNI